MSISVGAACASVFIIVDTCDGIGLLSYGIGEGYAHCGKSVTLQLFLIGFYLEYLFTWNSAWINLLWVIVMICVASWTVLGRTKLPVKQLFIPVIVAFFCSICIIDVYFLGIIIKLDHLFEARYFVPVSGMILGNMLSANVIALNAFYGSLDRERQLYFYLLANGATRGEATRRLCVKR